MMGLGWVLLAIGVGVQPSEFQIDTDTPDALCPEVSMTREAVRRRLGKLEVEGSGRWRGTYSTVHDPSGRRGDYVRLVIIDAAGKEQLSRELPMQGESCATLAQAIALVVDGFFRELGQTTPHEITNLAPAASSSKDGQGPAPAASAVESPAPVPAISEATRGAQDHNRAKAGLIIGGGYESVPSSPASSWGLFVTGTSGWRIQLQTGFPTARWRENHGSASAYAYPIPIRLTASYALQLSPKIQWLFGPDVLVSLEDGSSEGVPNVRSGWRASFGLGADSGIAYWLGDSVAVAAKASAGVIFFESRRFLMYNEPVLELARGRLAGGLELWAVIFR
jgi:hypothetical protein